MLELRQTISGSILERLAPLKWTFAVVIFVVVLAGEKKKSWFSGFSVLSTAVVSQPLVTSECV